MRFVDTSSFQPSANWSIRVTAALLQYSTNHTFLNIWQDLTHDLNALLRDDNQIKCWYTEVFVKGSNVDVDHFRPKSNVTELTDKFADLEPFVWSQIDQTARNGYANLAFEWKNFRIASQHSNQGRVDGRFTKGKQDFFPLKSGAQVATDLISSETEDICLLDPCRQNDAELLKFSTDGNADSPHPKTSWEYCRTKVSIEIYHLNFNKYGLVDARLQKWNECVREIEYLVKLHERNQQDLILDCYQKLVALTKKQSEFSAVAIDCIRHYAKQAQYIYIKPLSDKLVK